MEDRNSSHLASPYADCTAAQGGNMTTSLTGTFSNGGLEPHMKGEFLLVAEGIPQLTGHFLRAEVKMGY